MIDMKRSTTERKGEADVMMTEDEYPWGLRLNLDEAEIEKLGLDIKAVGDECMFVAKGRIVSASMHEEEGTGMDASVIKDQTAALFATDNKVHRSMSLQITEMDFGGSGEDDKAERLYGDNQD